ncbi:MAG: sulfatase-like hydrolase/transferase, partial [Planctomycetota bacterium]
DHYDDFVDEKESARPKWERRAARTPDAALAWLHTHRDAKRPLFLWIHYIDPHGPYRPPGDWEPTFRSERSRPVSEGRVLSYQLDPTVEDAYVYVDRYDEEIRYVDRHIGRLLDGYGPRLEEATVLFTADHGETMIEQELWFAHGHQVYESIVRVPLLLREPGRPPRRIDAPAHGTDLAPTILRAAGAEVPDGIPPVDLRNAEGMADDRLILVDTSLAYGQWTAAVRGDRKRMLRVRGRNREVVEGRGYDLAGDPHETRPLEWDPDDPLAKALLERVQSDPDPSGIPEEYAKGMKLSAPKVAPGASEEMLEKLRALGYAN